MTDQPTLRGRIADAISDFMAHSSSLCGGDYDAADAVLAVLPAPVVLTAAERQFLAFALDLAFDRMVSEGGFTDEDHAALDRFRRMADEAQQAEEAQR